MPNIMIHEEVGNFISKKINMSSYDFYLGLLAPDSPNIDGFGEKIERWTAHNRRKDLDEWRDSLKDFYNNNINNYNKDFLLGYYIHILTDIVYDDFLYKKVRKEIMKDNSISKEEAHTIMRNDMDNYYFKDINEIIKILNSNTKSYNILNINEDLLIKWKNKSINNFSNINKSKYITEEIINELNELVYDELKSII